MYDARDNEAQLEALQEIFDILGFTPTWRDNATMESLLRANERIEEALPFAKKCVDEIPREDPQRNTLLHDYAVGMLDITSVTCDEACYEADVKARDAIKVTAFREFMNIVSKERQGRIAELGAALCHQDSFEEGAKFYTQAMASGIDEPDLNEPFKVTCIAAAFQKASFN